ncbi:MAG: hypothetical protein ACW98U_01070 [Candidatus Thorarchaeota archaeon]
MSSHPKRGRRRFRSVIRLLYLSCILLFFSGFVIQADFSDSIRTIVPDSLELHPTQPSAIPQYIFPIGSYSYGAWSWTNQDPHGHATNHGTEFSMGQDQYSPFLCMEQTDERYTGWFYSGAVSYSGPALTALTTRLDLRTAWVQNSGDDGNCYYEVDLNIQKYTGGSWTNKGNWNNAWTYTGKSTNPTDRIKTDWGSGVVDGPGSYRLAIYMEVDGPGSGCKDSYWLYIEDFALFGEDDEPPTWVVLPTNQFVEFGNDINYDLDATDSAGIDHWWINGTSSFEIDSSGVITNNFPLSVGDYGIEVRVYDTQNNYQTATFQVSVQDTTNPTWDQTPTDQQFVLGLHFEYNVNASDLSGIDYYWVSSASNFVVDSSGRISNNTILILTTYFIEIRAYDVYGNFVWVMIHINAVNADPVWDEIPSNQVIEFGSQFQYDLNASAYFGVDDYWVNDTTYFSIDSTGLLTNLSLVPVGVYRLEVHAYDPDSRYCSAIFSLTFEDTTSPEWIEIPPNLVIEFGSVLLFKLNATDLSGLDNWWINNTLYFTIDNSGMLTTEGFSIGHFGIQVRVNDTYGNVLTGSFSILVRDTTPPTWSEMPSDQTIFEDEPLDYRLSATDISGIDDYAINDTIHFSITSSGRITSIGLPPSGIYGISVQVYDIFGNSIGTEFTVTILSVTSETTTFPTTLPDLLGGIVLVFAGVAVGVVVIVVVNILLKRRGE